MKPRWRNHAEGACAGYLGQSRIRTHALKGILRKGKDKAALDRDALALTGGMEGSIRDGPTDELSKPAGASGF